MKKTILAILEAFVTAWAWVKHVVTWPVRRRRRSPQFDGWGFAVGSVRGVRDFRVDADGNLTGVSVQEIWTDGENKARCITSFMPGLLHLLAKGTLTVKRPADMDPDCSCGFYAYFNAKWRAFSFVDGSQTIPAVIEAYGKVNLGSKGFRAEKARIRALSFHQPWERRGSWDRPVQHVFWVAWGLGTLIGDSVGLAIGRSGWGGLAFDVLFWGSMGGLHLWSCIDILRARRAVKNGCPQGDPHNEPPVVRNPLPGPLARIPFVRGANCRCTWRMLRATQRISDDTAVKIRAKYPDVEIFDSMPAMLKAFPPDEPSARERS